MRSVMVAACVLALGCSDDASSGADSNGETSTSSGGSTGSTTGGLGPEPGKGPIPPDLQDGFIDGIVPLTYGFANGDWVAGWPLGGSAGEYNLARARTSQVYVLCRDAVYDECPMAERPAGKTLFPTLPRDEGYSPYWQVHKVRVPDDYVDDSIKSVTRLMETSLEIEPLPMAVNCPVHKLTAKLEGNGEDGTRLIGDGGAWYEGYSLYYWDFSKTAGMIPLVDGVVEPAELWLAFRQGMGVPESEPLQMTDLNGDGDTHDTNNLLAPLTANGAMNQLYSVAGFVAGDAVTLATEVDDPQAATIKTKMALATALADGAAMLYQGGDEIEKLNFVARVPE